MSRKLNSPACRAELSLGRFVRTQNCSYYDFAKARTSRACLQDVVVVSPDTPMDRHTPSRLVVRQLCLMPGKMVASRGYARGATVHCSLRTMSRSPRLNRISAI